MPTISLAAAVELITGASAPLATEDVPVGKALGRVLAGDAIAAHDVQPFDNSAMDGFAVRAGDGARLRIVGESRAGAPAGERVGAGEAARISTGALIPAGADAVVRVEDTSLHGDEVEIAIDPAPGDNIRRAGEDVGAGELVVATGSDLGPAELAACATAGIVTLPCVRRPRLRVVVTGDELVPPGEELGPGQIHESNGLAIGGLAERAGCEAPPVRRAADDAGVVAEVIDWAKDDSDVLVVCGGISVGEHDHVREALLQAGFDERFWGLDLKPGKPAWFGTRGPQLAFALPGNPASAMVTFELLVRPAVDALLGRSRGRPVVAARLTHAVPRRAARTEAVRVRLESQDDGWAAIPTGAQGSHRMLSMVGADGLAIVPSEVGRLEPGDVVRVLMLER